MSLAIGSTVMVAGIEWIILDKDEDSVLCLTRDFVYRRTRFDDNTNNYANSAIRRKLEDEFLTQITNAIGNDTICKTVIDLTSDDGLDDYGYVIAKVGLLTDSAYRKYNRIIEKYPVDSWWWLATPYSTPHRGWSYTVRCVRNGGALDGSSCYYYGGIRPFCIFKSSIFESF